MNSVSSQSHAETEHVIIDGASEDTTIALIDDALHSKSLFISEQDAGIYDAMNKGIDLSSGHIIGFLGAGDRFWDESILEIVANRFCNNEALLGVYGDLAFLADEKRIFKTRSWVDGAYTIEKLKNGWMPPHPTFFVRRDWFVEIGRFDPSYRVSGDYDFILRCFSNADFFAEYIDRVMVVMEAGGISNSGFKNHLLKLKEDGRALLANGFGVGGLIRATLGKRIRKMLHFSFTL